jgi:uncharacterized iron-regulated protein
MDRSKVEDLRAKLEIDRAQVAASLARVEGAIAACDRLIADDDAEMNAQIDADMLAVLAETKPARKSKAKA